MTPGSATLSAVITALERGRSWSNSKACVSFMADKVFVDKKFGIGDEVVRETEQMPRERWAVLGELQCRDEGVHCPAEGYGKKRSAKIS